jgi:hypothetical protein
MLPVVLGRGTVNPTTTEHLSHPGLDPGSMLNSGGAAAPQYVGLREGAQFAVQRRAQPPAQATISGLGLPAKSHP